MTGGDYVDRKQADRIIVKSNARMKKVLDWYLKNREWLDKETFHAPMEYGVIELQEELLDIAFEVMDEDKVEITIFPTIKPNLPASVILDYNPHTGIATNYRFAPGLPKVKQDLMRIIILADRTDMKEVIKYHALMLFMVHYQEIVTVSETRPRTKHEAKKIRKDRSKPLPLIRKTYVLADADKKILRKPGDKRAYTKPDHEVNVRGYQRRYKSGKTVWVKPSVRYKGKGTKRKEYEL